MLNTAPVILFVYNRPEHTLKTIKSLRENYLASSSDLYIYSDYARSDKDVNSVKKVRDMLRKVDGFQSVSVTYQKENLGLAKSITLGVTELLDRYDRVIVLEDDMVTSKSFLTFMNGALQKYKEQKRVWHIGGWNFPLSTLSSADAYFWRVMNCWGWATWSDRWSKYEKAPAKLLSEFDKEKIYKFNIDGCNNFWQQVVENNNGRINTWAIFWYATIFKHDGMCLNPSKSLVKNIGMDGSGVHCSSTGVFDVILSDKQKFFYPEDVCENEETLEKIKGFYREVRPSLQERIKTYIYSKFLAPVKGAFD